VSARRSVTRILLAACPSATTDAAYTHADACRMTDGAGIRRPPGHAVRPPVEALVDRVLGYLLDAGFSGGEWRGYLTCSLATGASE
jgi:hypothetical protein